MTPGSDLQGAGWIEHGWWSRAGQRYEHAGCAAPVSAVV